MEQFEKSRKNSQSSFIWPLLILAVIVIFVLLILVLAISSWDRISNGNNNGEITKLPKFSSCSALYDKLEENKDKGFGRGILEEFGVGLGAPTSLKSQDAGGSIDYSQTNIQVQGVDEADIVKTDGKYIYTVSDQTLTVSMAYPESDAKLLSKITFDTNNSPLEIFLEGNNLLVFGSYYLLLSGDEPIGEEKSLIYPYYDRNYTFVEIYDLSNPESPELKRRLEFEGDYQSSRKIDNQVYFVLNSYPSYYILEEEPQTLEDTELVPVYRDYQENEINAEDKGFESIAGCAQVSYIDPIVTNQYLTVVSLPIDDFEAKINKEVILGGSQNVYASLNNLYLANTNYDYSGGFLEQILPLESKEETIIYKFNLDKGQIKFQTKDTVSGTVLNQFSMDEYKEHFRIATTRGHVSQTGSDTSNNVYILDEDLKTVGSLEDIAPGEKIYSARFMGAKAYLVTFKKVDPFFTLDVSDPKNPKVVGKLKIPGYSDYLHPYDENHIIGIGKEAVEAEEGDFAWYQGMKMAIFDVTDFKNPKEMHKVVIGDRGTDSPILNDHKAFLFNKEKNLLALPILLAEISPAVKENPEVVSNTYGDYKFQGTYVYEISLDKGFELRGKITHIDQEDDVFQKSGFYFGEGGDSIERNLYINDNFYSVSDNKIKINSLLDLNELAEISLK